jgi:hypothetical protein
VFALAALGGAVKLFEMGHWMLGGLAAVIANGVAVWVLKEWDRPPPQKPPSETV